MHVFKCDVQCDVVAILDHLGVTIKLGVLPHSRGIVLCTLLYIAGTVDDYMSSLEVFCLFQPLLFEK